MKLIDNLNECRELIFNLLFEYDYLLSDDTINQLKETKTQLHELIEFIEKKPKNEKFSITT